MREIRDCVIAGHALRQRREATGVGQKELADHLKVNPSTVWRVEQREAVPAATVSRYLNALAAAIHVRHERNRATAEALMDAARELLASA
jgi:ribosome-binding protein aMBF1 (putative translation factor)